MFEYNSGKLTGRLLLSQVSRYLTVSITVLYGLPVCATRKSNEILLQNFVSRVIKARLLSSPGETYAAVNYQPTHAGDSLDVGCGQSPVWFLLDVCQVNRSCGSVDVSRGRDATGGFRRVLISEAMQRAKHRCIGAACWRTTS